jgi:hypothetical protein
MVEPGVETRQTVLIDSHEALSNKHATTRALQPNVKHLFQNEKLWNSPISRLPGLGEFIMAEAK